MKKLLILFFTVIYFQLSAQNNVGIGTASPHSRLHIHDPVGFGYARFSNNETGSSSSDGTFIGAFNKDFLIYNQEINGMISMYTGGGIRRMTIDSFGNAGIGFGLSAFTPRLFSLNGTMGFYNANSLKGEITTSATTMTIKPDPGNALCLPNPCPGTNLVLVPPPGIFETTGNVGIQITNPAYKLHVYDDIGLRSTNSTGAQINFEDELGVNKSFINLTGNDIKLGTLASNNNGKFIIRTNGGDRFFIDSAGNVTIGSAYKAASGYRMSLNGKLMCEEVRVQLDADWPDYVFNKEYKLMPLSELQKFINENKHLPGILPAAEVKANGIELGDTNKRMMEKIEELTLYILELKKEIDLLKLK